MYFIALPPYILRILPSPVDCNRLIICLVVGRRKNAAMSVLLFNFLSQFVLWQCERLFHSGESIHCP